MFTLKGTLTDTSKKWCFEKYCSCDKTCQVYLENLEIDDKFVNIRVQLFINQTMSL